MAKNTLGAQLGTSFRTVADLTCTSSQKCPLTLNHGIPPDIDIFHFSKIRKGASINTAVSFLPSVTL